MLFSHEEYVPDMLHSGYLRSWGWRMLTRVATRERLCILPHKIGNSARGLRQENKSGFAKKNITNNNYWILYFDSTEEDKMEWNY